MTAGDPARRTGGNLYNRQMLAALRRDGVRVTTVVLGDRLYIGVGVYPDHPSPAVNFGYILCLDITKTGDVSPATLDSKNSDSKNSALVWAYGGVIQPPPQKGRKVTFGKTLSTAAARAPAARIPAIVRPRMSAPCNLRLRCDQNVGAEAPARKGGEALWRSFVA